MDGPVAIVAAATATSSQADRHGDGVCNQEFSAMSHVNLLGRPRDSVGPRRGTYSRQDSGYRLGWRGDLLVMECR